MMNTKTGVPDLDNDGVHLGKVIIVGHIMAITLLTVTMNIVVADDGMQGALIHPAEPSAEVDLVASPVHRMPTTLQLRMRSKRELGLLQIIRIEEKYIELRVVHDLMIAHLEVMLVFTPKNLLHQMLSLMSHQLKAPPSHLFPMARLNLAQL
jgi:hypothetical protein